MVVVIVLMMVVVVRILFWDDDVVVRFRKNFFVVFCPRDLFLRVLVIMIIFFRIVVGVVHGVLELRFLAPCVIVVRLVVVEDVDVAVGVDQGVVLHPLCLGLNEGGLPILGTVELIVIIVLTFNGVCGDNRLFVRTGSRTPS